MFRGFFVPIGIVKDELVVLNELSDAVHFDLGLVDLYPRVEAGDGVDLAIQGFLFKQGSLTHAYAYIHGVG